jgi:hypothetical protein
LKKILIIGICCAVTLYLTEFGQLLSIPTLIGHYFEHTETEENLTFIDYLHEHYCHEHKHCEHHDTGKLPYQNVDSGFFSLVYIHELQEEIHFLSFSSFPEVNYSHNDRFCSELHRDIWQPPKLV